MVNFPTSLDSFTNPTATNYTNSPSLSGQQSDQNDAIEALEAKVGADGSAVTTSHDYKLSGVTGTDKAVSKTGTETLTNKTLTSPTLTTPALGTPASGVLTNCTGLPEGGLTLADNTTNDVSTTKHGLAPKAPNDTTKFLRGDGSWAVPAPTPTVITVANEAADTTCFPLFATAATGDLGPKSSAGLTFDSANLRLGLNTASPSSRIHLTNGSIRITGGSSDTYTTPVGYTPTSKFIVDNYALTNYESIFAMGVIAASAVDSLAISINDARTTAHRPTLMLVNPTESNGMGLTFDGSDTVGYLKSGVALGLKVNSLDGAGNEAIHIDVSGNVSLNYNGSGTTQVVSLTASKPVFTDGSKNLVSTGTLGIDQGGTGQTTANAGFNALSPMTTAGDIIYGGASGAGTRLAIGGANTVLHGGASAPAYSAVVEADITLADNTTNDVSTTKHGLVPKAPNDTTKFLRGDATWAVPSGGSGTDMFSLTAVTLCSEGKVGTTSVSGTAAADTSDGQLALSTGATAASQARVKVGLIAAYDSSSNQIGVNFSKNISCRLMVHGFVTGTNGVQTFGTGANMYNGGTAYTSRHLGFRIAGTTVYATNANNTTETTTDITASVTLTNTPQDWMWIFTTGTNCKFYWNGTLLATHTTNLPSGTNVSHYSIDAVVANPTTAANRAMSIGGIVYQQAI